MFCVSVDVEFRWNWLCRFRCLCQVAIKFYRRDCHVDDVDTRRRNDCGNVWLSFTSSDINQHLCGVHRASATVRRVYANDAVARGRRIIMHSCVAVAYLQLLNSAVMFINLL